MNFLLRILISALAALITQYILPGVELDSFITALLLAFVLAILNLLVKPVLLILTLPITVFTLGLFIFVINAIIILIASELIDGFRVDGFWWALLFSLVQTLISSFLYSLGPGAKNDEEF
ncbi:hypothetical protein COR50_04950 [Chitinophaga caeni]|uniref:Phage holin family protein n=1 Tax=Chitinophaga caeni TaxID=2029983 RepID=A0A291R0R7_9BACT|nr:phage holin family protein [Chitinophaga caeni]ATL49732.1 hypothetical protein COR50_04950 [Chitinophaga caeni]